MTLPATRINTTKVTKVSKYVILKLGGAGAGCGSANVDNVICERSLISYLNLNILFYLKNKLLIKFFILVIVSKDFKLIQCLPAIP